MSPLFFVFSTRKRGPLYVGVRVRRSKPLILPAGHVTQLAVIHNFSNEMVFSKRRHSKIKALDASPTHCLPLSPIVKIILQVDTQNRIETTRPREGVHNPWATKR